MSAALAVIAVMAFSATQAASAAQSGSSATASAKKKGRGHHKKKPVTVKPKLKLITKAQKTLLAGQLQVRVIAKRKAKVVLTSTSTTFDDGSKVLTKPKTLRFGKKSNRKVVILTLTSS